MPAAAAQLADIAAAASPALNLFSTAQEFLAPTRNSVVRSYLLEKGFSFSHNVTIVVGKTIKIFPLLCFGMMPCSILRVVVICVQKNF